MHNHSLSKILIISLMSLYAFSATLADDLEVYSSSGGVDAKIMFVLDASGSMLQALDGSDIDCGYSAAERSGKANYDQHTFNAAKYSAGDYYNRTYTVDGVETTYTSIDEKCFAETRMKNLQTAFEKVITELKDQPGLGVGLTWFGGLTGGGIKFPVAGITKNANIVDDSIAADLKVSDVLINMVNNLYSFEDYTPAYVGQNPSDSGLTVICNQFSSWGCNKDDVGNGNYLTKFNTLRADSAHMLTPTVDALYETARYFRGDYILYGARDHFAPWNSTYNTYKLSPERQTVGSLTENYRFSDLYVYGSASDDGIPVTDRLQTAGETDFVLGSDSTSFDYINEYPIHRSGPLHGWRAANPATYQKNAQSKAREYVTPGHHWPFADISASPPEIADACQWTKGYPGWGGSWTTEQKKGYASWFKCNLVEDPAQNKPTNDADWNTYNPATNSNSLVVCNNVLTAGYQYDRTFAQYLTDLLISQASAEGKSNSGGGGGGNNTTCGFKYKSVAKYTSPLEECSKGAVILISDGHPTANTADYESNIDNGTTRLGSDSEGNAGLVRKLIGQTGQDCEVVGGNGVPFEKNIRKYGRCGPDLTGYLADNNQNPTVARTNYGTVDTYTVAFAITDAAEKTATDNYLKKLSHHVNADDAGQGEVKKHYTATDAASLAAAIKEIVENITESSDDASGPVITLDKSQLKTAESTYIPMFRSSGSPSWEANIKGYQLIDGSLLDVSGNPALSESTNQFIPESVSFWSSVADGGIVDKGGLNEWILEEAKDNNSVNRNLYVTTDPDDVPGLNNANENRLTSEDDYLLTTDNTLLTLNSMTQTSVAVPAGLTEAEFADQLIEDFRGLPLADSIHSKPVLIQYDTDDKVLFTTSNRGLLHAFDVSSNTSTGNELWGFMPAPSVSSIYGQIKNDTDITNGHIYTLDAPIRVWYHDADQDGKISVLNATGDATGDFVYLYFGMRRGGSYYYAMDVTNKSQPRLMWKIAAGDTGFKELGNTWSPINLIRVKDTTAAGSKVVAVFGGGYRSDNQDDVTNGLRSNSASEAIPNCINGTSVTNTDCKAQDGLGIYLVDAINGDLVNSIGPDSTFTGTATNSFNAVENEMKFAIPSDLRVIDSSGDGYTDRIYFGDMGGQVWKVEIKSVINAEQADGTFQDTTIGISDVQALKATRLADFGIDESSNHSASTHRRFYYPPAVALLSPGKYAVAIGSGHRASPLHGLDTVNDTFVEDNMFVLHDSSGAPFPLDISDLDDVTTSTVPVNSINHGWRIELKTDTGWEGEKMISTPLIFNNKLLFLTFIPSPGTGTSCSLADTQNLFYAVDLTSAATAEEVTQVTAPNGDRTLKANKTREAANVLSNSKMEGDLNVISAAANTGGKEECYEALAGTDSMIKFCLTPAKVYWKELQ